MDIFDKYLFDELATQYAKTDLSRDDYEELYIRFSNLNYLSEVQPYLQTMRFWGLGTEPEKEKVLSELKESFSENDYILKGLYYDLLLSVDDNNTDAFMNLEQMVAEGYTNVFTKEKSYIEKIKVAEKRCENETVTYDEKVEINEEEIVVNTISFVCGDYSGYSFAAGETDYLQAIIYIKPLTSGKRHIVVESQIFLDEAPFSKIFTNEYDIDTGTTWVRTTGWGNKSKNCYSSNVYNWVIKINDEKTFSQKFTMYNGTIDLFGPSVVDIKIFESRWEKVLEEEHTKYRTTFSADKLECINLKFLIKEQEKNMLVQVKQKIIYLEDNSEFCNTIFLRNIRSNSNYFWIGWGYKNPGKWKKGLYKYIVSIGDGKKYEGIFTVC